MPRRLNHESHEVHEPFFAPFSRPSRFGSRFRVLPWASWLGRAGSAHRTCVPTQAFFSRSLCRRGMRTLLLAAAVSALLLSGCSSSEGGKLSDAEARAAAQKALEDFAEDFTSGSGDLSKITGEFEVDDGQLGDADVSFELERGKDDVLLIDMEAGGSGVTFNVQAYCSPTIEIISMGEASYASRPAVEDSCLGSGLDDSAFDVE